MEPDKLRTIAEHSGTTVSTVRRVLGHCSGIAAETREAVIYAQCSLNHPTAHSAHRLYVMLPDNPKFFWHNALDVLNGYAFDPPVKLSFYPSLQQNNALKRYLEPLLTEEHIALIVAADLTAEQQVMVSKIAQHSFVIQLCHHTPISGTVAVTADAYADGVALGATAATYTPKNTVILQRPGSHSFSECCRGFENGLGLPVVYVTEPEEGPLYSSMLARLLEPLNNVDMVFSPSGRTAELCRAIYKLRRNIRCVGCELSPQLEKMPKNTAVCAVLQQDLAAQTRTALELAKAYLAHNIWPIKTAYTLPSHIVKTF